jgi:anti-anti-sigma factor
MTGEIGHFHTVRAGAEAVVVLHGEHDLSTAPELRKLLHELVDEGRNVVVDVSDTEFLDCSIIHALFDADAVLRGQGRWLVLQVGTTCRVKRALEVAGVLDHVPTAAAREEVFELARDGRPMAIRSH